MPASSCPTCGRVVQEDTPGGVCPACALADLLGAATRGGGGPLDLLDLPLEGGSPARLGDYELLEPIGRGGMGAVYRARQRSLNRVVALKVLAGGRHAGEDLRRRFRLEAEAAGRLQHPNIVPVHEVGETDGQAYFSMEYVAGPTLADLVRERPLAPRLAAYQVRIVADAIEYAHRQGLLHRDLKPSNILLGDDGRPRITDFGLARRIDAESDLTVSGTTLGTPAYLPPEQASVSRGALGPWSDVYALGAVLYHLLTGRPPFLAESIADILRQVLESEPVPLRRLNPAIPRDLETISLKCLDKIPSRRYASAAALASDLEAWLAGRTISARPAGAILRASRWARRHPALTLAAALAVVAAGLGTALAWQRRSTLREESRAQEASLQSINTRRLAQIQTAEVRDARGEPRTLLLTLARILRESSTNAAQAVLPSSRIAAERLLGLITTRTHLLPISEPIVHPIEDGAFALDPDAVRCAVAFRDGTVRLWDFARGSWFREPLQHPADVRLIEFSADGRLLYTFSADGRSRIWDLDRSPSTRPALPPGSDRQPDAGDPGPRHVLDHPSAVRLARFQPDAPQSLLLLLERDVVLVDPVSGRESIRFQAHPTAPTHAEFGPNGAFVVSMAAGEARVWNPLTGRELREPLPLPTGARLPRLSPDGTRLAIAQGATVHLVPLFPESAMPQVVLHHRASVRALAWSPEGHRIATATATATVAAPSVDSSTGQVWDAVSGKVLSGPFGHRDAFHQLEFSPNGLWLVTASDDATVRMWEARTGRALCEPLAHVDRVHQARFTASGAELVTFAALEVVAWRVRLESASPCLWPGDSPIGFVDLTADGARLLQATRDRRLLVSSLHTAEPAAPPIISPSDWRHAQFTASPDHLLTVDSEGKLRLWHWPTATLAAERDAGGAAMTGAHSSADKRVVAFAWEDGSTSLWDVTDTLRPLAQVQHPNPTLSLQVSPDGTVLGSVTAAGALALQDARTGVPLGDRITEVPREWVPFSRSLIRDLAESMARTNDRAFLLGQTVNAVAPAEEPPPRGNLAPRTLGDWIDKLEEAAVEESTLTVTGVRSDGRNSFEALFRAGTVPWAWNCAFSADSRLVAAATAWGTVLVWNVNRHDPASRRPVLELSQNATALAFAFSPESDRLVSGGEDGTVRVWDLESGEEIVEILAHGAGIRQAGFSPEGRRVFTVALDGEARVWDAGTGLPVSDPFRHPAPVRKALFTPNGQRLLTLDGEGRVRLWDVLAPDAPAPRWLPRVAEVLAGRDSAAARALPLSASERLAVMQQRTRKPAGDTFSRWAAWALTPGIDRPASFLGTPTARDQVATAIRLGTRDSLERAIRIEPTNVAALDRLARWRVSPAESNPAQSEAEGGHLLRLARRLATTPQGAALDDASRRGTADP